MEDFPPFVLILLIIVAVAALAGGAYVILRGRTENTITEESEEDEKVFDETTGKFVTVEELIQGHGTFVLDDKFVDEVFQALDPVNQDRISRKQLEEILELYYNARAWNGEESGEENHQDGLVSLKNILAVRHHPQAEDLAVAIHSALPEK